MSMSRGGDETQLTDERLAAEIELLGEVITVVSTHAGPLSPDEVDDVLGVGDAQLAHAGLEDPGLEDPGLEDPGLEDPGLEDPGLEDPGLERDPGLEDPGIGDPDPSD